MAAGVRHPRNVNHSGWSAKLRGPSGRGLCRICLVEVPKGHRTFCGPTCVEAHWIGVGAYRKPVEARDKGVCAICGMDTRALDRVLSALHKAEKPRVCCGKDAEYTPRGYRDYSQWDHHASLLLRELGWNRFPALNRSLWEADHITPICEGGKNAMDNLRTLCVPCHRDETRKLMGRRRGIKRGPRFRGGYSGGRRSA